MLMDSKKKSHFGHALYSLANIFPFSDSLFCSEELLPFQKQCTQGPCSFYKSTIVYWKKISTLQRMPG